MGKKIQTVQDRFYDRVAGASHSPGGLLACETVKGIGPGIWTDILLRLRATVNLCLLLLFFLATMLNTAGPARARDIDAALQSCLLRVLQEAGDETTVGELRSMCEEQHMEKDFSQPEESAADYDTALGQRLQEEREGGSNLWTIMPHRPNYLLFASHNFSSMNEAPWRESSEVNAALYETEAKFQISFKFMLWESLLHREIDLYLAYTQLSIWQLYNKDISSPFRDSNYEPEFFFTLGNTWRIFGFNNRLNAFGVSHQSNGRSEPLSRSWNRLWASFIFEKGNLAWGIKLWYRIPESSDNDDNPDIEDYLGYGHLLAVYKRGDNTFGLMWRNNLDFDENRGAVEVNWSFPLPGTERIKGYLQYFNGYGQCLLDYNASSSTLGVGLLLTDWL